VGQRSGTPGTGIAGPRTPAGVLEVSGKLKKLVPWAQVPRPCQGAKAMLTGFPVVAVALHHRLRSAAPSAQNQKMWVMARLPARPTEVWIASASLKISLLKF
jgi:hypothetical protein